MDAKEKEEGQEVSVIDKPDIITEGLRYVPKKEKAVAVKGILGGWLRRVTITIDDKNDNDPISVVFEGDWSGRDLNLASKSLLLEYGVYVRNR